jgi:tetratricopeptide (TPR) repeat protein
MENHTFFDNPDFSKYVRLLRDLHEAIREGRDESEPGEAIRDEMDDPGSRLSPAEIDTINGISADFYSLVEEPPVSARPRSDEIQGDLAEVARRRDTGDYQGALDLLRRRSESLNADELAYHRGLIWKKAGEHEIAALFLRRAAELDPSSFMNDPIGSSGETVGSRTGEPSRMSDRGSVLS